MSPTYKYEIWFDGAHRHRLACESNLIQFKTRFNEAYRAGNLMAVGDQMIFDPQKVMYYTYQGEGKW